MSHVKSFEHPLLLRSGTAGLCADACHLLDLRGGSVEARHLSDKPAARGQSPHARSP